MGSRAGIAIDGTTATVVIAHDSGDTLAVETVRTVHAASVPTLLRQCLPLLRAGDPVRVALAVPNTATATLTGSADLLPRAAFLRAARTATGAGDGVAIAGHVADPDAARAGRLSTILVSTAPADAVAEVQAVLRDRHPLEVTTPALVHGPVDGLSLALRGSGAELVLTVAGAPVAAATLRAGGLDTLTAVLAGDTARVQAALAGDAPDPIAAAEVQRWLGTVIDELRTVLTDFSRRGLPTTKDVFVHGTGASAAGLTAALADAGLTRREHPVLRALPGAPDTRPAVVTAYLAAATHGTGLPHAAFVDHVELAAARRTARAAARRTRLLHAAAALTVAALAAAGPTGYASARTWAAERDRDAAHAQAMAIPAQAAGAEAVALTELRAALAAPSRQSAAAAAAALTAAQGRATVTAVRVTGTTGTATRAVLVTGHADTLSQATGWAGATRAALTRSGTAATVAPTTVTRAGNGVDVTLQITATERASR